MKVLTAYEFLGRAFSHPEALIDYCLASIDEGNACNIVDVTYVLHQCHQVTDYRRDDLCDFAERQDRVISRHRREDGAYSFFPKHAGTHYYGARMSRGLVESDIHGTHLLLWAQRLLAGLLHPGEDVSLKLPVT
jgi:hypothetical protein